MSGRPGSTNAEAAVLERLDLDYAVDLLRELVAFRSDGGRESPVQSRVADEMRSLGMEVDEWAIDLDQLSEHPRYSAEIERAHAQGVVGSLGGTGRTLVLNGHTDVVPAGDLDRWSSDPFAAEVRDGCVYGRGTCDMKGGLVCALAAARALRDAGVEPAGPVKIQSVAGEEDGGLGTLASILRGHTGDGAIVMEPTELMVAPAQGGALGFRITVPGRAAHGALRTEGVSPFEAYLPVYAALRALERRQNDAVDDPLFEAYDIPFPLCVGRVSSGIWPSTEAESLVAEGRLGVGTHESVEDVRRRFEAAVQTAADESPWLRTHPPQIEWEGARFDPAATPVDDPVVRVVAEAHRDVAAEPAVLRGMPYGADMRLFVLEAGMPCVMYGPGDIRRAHAPDEFVPIADLEVCTRTLALTMLRYGSGA